MDEMTKIPTGAGKSSFDLVDHIKLFKKFKAVMRFI